MTAFDESLCDAINAYWAARGRQANARVGVQIVEVFRDRYGWPITKPEEVTSTAIISDIDPRWPDEPAGNQLRGAPAERPAAPCRKSSLFNSPAVAPVAAGTFSGGRR